jgi:hypothetical protein
MKLLILSLLFFVSSCSYLPKVYKATIGISSTNSNFVSIDSDGNEDRLCVQNPPNTDGASTCTGGGYHKYQNYGYIDPGVEFYPRYYKDKNIGYSYFFSYSSIAATLLDYPTPNESSSIRIRKFSINPNIFYNWGDKLIENGKGLSFKVGLGVSLNYVAKFKLVRLDTSEVYDDYDPIDYGFALFLELNWDWFTFRIENSQIILDGKKFSDVKEDELNLDAAKASFLYSYYFN